MNNEYFIERKAFLEKEIARLEKEIEKYPKGNLSAYREGDYVRWRIYNEDDAKDYKTLKKKQLSLAQLFARKRVSKQKLKDMQNELKSIFKYLNCRKLSDWSWLTAKDSTYRELLFEDDWEYQLYEKKTEHPKQLTNDAPKGEKVRSKSEAFIATALYERGIPYHYEEYHYFGNTRLGPDFTIRHPETGELYIWEHFGIIDKENYQEEFLFKIPLYLKAGYYPGVNLITTYETKDDPLSIDTIRNTIHEYFG